MQRGIKPRPRVLPAVGLVQSETSTRLYVFGGGVDSSNPIQDTAMYCYDTTKNFWAVISKGENGPSPRIGHTITSVGSKLYIFGGMNGGENGFFSNAMFVYDTMTNKWTKNPDREDDPPPRAGHSATALGTLIFVTGGLTTGMTALDDVYAYNTGFIN